MFIFSQSASWTDTPAAAYSAHALDLPPASSRDVSAGADTVCCPCFDSPPDPALGGLQTGPASLNSTKLETLAFFQPLAVSTSYSSYRPPWLILDVEVILIRTRFCFLVKTRINKACRAFSCWCNSISSLPASASVAINSLELISSNWLLNCTT